MPDRCWSWWNGIAGCRPPVPIWPGRPRSGPGHQTQATGCWTGLQRGVLLFDCCYSLRVTHLLSRRCCSVVCFCSTAATPGVPGRRRSCSWPATNAPAIGMGHRAVELRRRRRRCQPQTCSARRSFKLGHVVSGCINERLVQRRWVTSFLISGRGAGVSPDGRASFG